MHLRLCRPEQFHQLVAGEQRLHVTRFEGLTRWCLPFNHMLLWAGKQLYGRLPASSNAYRSMEKFEYARTPHRHLGWNPITWAIRLMRFIDRRNDRLRNPYGPCVNLAISSGPEGAMRSGGAPLVQTTAPRIRSCSSAVHPSLSRRVGVTALAGGD